MCCTLMQMMNYINLIGCLDHLINSLTGFPLKINDWLINLFIILPVAIYCCNIIIIMHIAIAVCPSHLLCYLKAIA